jgi:hypothetical protein
MPYPIFENDRMNRNSNRMDAEPEKQIEGLTASQIRLLASIYAGLADRLRKKTVTEGLVNWKRRDDYSKN